MRKGIYYLIIILLGITACHRNRIDLSAYKDKFSQVKALVFLPVKANFSLADIQRYRLNIISIEYISLNTPYMVFPYALKDDCKLKDIYICSDFKNVITRYRIEPNQLIFFEYSLIEESNVVMAEVLSKGGRGAANALNSDLRYKLVIKGYNYRGAPVFEYRYEFAPDINSENILSPVYNQIQFFLRDFVSALYNLYKFSQTRDNVKYYINHFQYFYNDGKKTDEKCKRIKIDTESEIEGELFLKEYYQNISKQDIDTMKNFSCGILVKGFGEDLFSRLGVKSGDLIVDFCGNKVYGYYSVHNAILANLCEEDSKILIYRDNRLIELPFKRRVD